MIKRTLGDVKPELSVYAGSSGMAVTDPRFLARLNRAIEELMNEGDWPGVVDRYRFAIYGGVLTLPSSLNRVMGIALEGEPVEMLSAWYEFSAGGPGENSGWTDCALDHGESCVFRNVPVPDAHQLKVTCDFDERVNGVRPKIILRGYDENGLWIRSSIGDGVEVEINGDGAPLLALTEKRFSHVASVHKPTTRGYVHLHASTTGAPHLASFAPSETRPSYRQYKIPGLPEDKVHRLVIRAKKRFIPLRVDSDELLISNLSALELMLTALQARAASDIGKYHANRQMAVQLLKKEAESYRGKTVKPAITFSRNFGSGNIEHAQ